MVDSSNAVHGFRRLPEAGIVIVGLLAAIAGTVLPGGTYLNMLAAGPFGVVLRYFEEHWIWFLVSLIAMVVGVSLVVAGVRKRLMRRYPDRGVLGNIVGLSAGMTAGVIAVSPIVGPIVGGIVALVAGAGHVLGATFEVFSCAALGGALVGLLGVLVGGYVGSIREKKIGEKRKTAGKAGGIIAIVCAVGDVAIGLIASLALVVSEMRTVELSEVGWTILFLAWFWGLGGVAAFGGTVAGLMGAGVGGLVGLSLSTLAGKVVSAVKAQEGECA